MYWWLTLISLFWVALFAAPWFLWPGWIAVGCNLGGLGLVLGLGLYLRKAGLL